MRTCKWMVAAFLLITLSAVAQQQAAPGATQPAADPAPAQTSNAAPTTLDQVVERAVAREHALIQMLANRTPLVETYLQNLKNDSELGPVPSGDHYYFGRLDMSENGRRDYLGKGSFQDNLLGGFGRLFKYDYNPAGFSWMVFADREDFNRETYDFRYVHREFLGDVRCIVFDVTPKPKSGKGRFQGRIWVEDQDFNIVRLNGKMCIRDSLYTAYELIERRFGRRLRSLTAGLFLLTRAAAEGVRVYAVSIVVAIALGTGEIASIAIITALTLIYTFEGGLAAVIWTDVVQTVIYVGGTLVGAFTILHLVPGGWATIHRVAANSGKLQVFDFSFDPWKPYTFWAGLVGGAFLTTASHGTDQLIVQRLLAARNQRQSVTALLSSGVALLFQFALFLMVGVMLFVFYRQPSANFGNCLLYTSPRPPGRQR